MKATTANALAMVKLDREIVKEQFGDLGITLDGPNKVKCKEVPEVESTHAAAKLIEQMITVSGLVRGNRAKGYWEGIVKDVVSEMRREGREAIKKAVAFDSSLDQSELRKFVNAVVISPKEEDYAAFYHFCWQVKRKLHDLKVTYHMMPILTGVQGSGKSTALKHFCSPFGEFVLSGAGLDSLSDAKSYQSLSDYLIFFSDELMKMEKADMNSLKAMITADTVKGRIMYTQETGEYVQRCTFIGTSNDIHSDLVKDTTGLRRFFFMKSPAAVDKDAVRNPSAHWRGSRRSRWDAP